MGYAIRITRDSEGFYYAAIPDLPGCVSNGDTLEEAVKNLEKEEKAWLKSAKKAGRKIPVPEQEREYSGRFVLRIDKQLHEELSKEAKREGTSLNDYLKKLIVSGRRNVDYDAIQESLSKLVDINDRAISLAEGEHKHMKHLATFLFLAEATREAGVTSSVELRVIEGGRRD